MLSQTCPNRSALPEWDAAASRQEVQRLQTSEKESAVLRARDAKLQTALAEKNLENLELRWRLAAAREATNPSLAQVSNTYLPHQGKPHADYERSLLDTSHLEHIYTMPLKRKVECLALHIADRSAFSSQ